MSKYEGLYTFDVDNHRYIPVGQADGIIDCFKFKHESKEPLIKDEKTRKAVRAWAEVCGIDGVVIVSKYQLVSLYKPCSIEFRGAIYPDYVHDEEHTIAELCGKEDAPRPLEPTFVDLDERIKEKEEE